MKKETEVSGMKSLYVFASIAMFVGAILPMQVSAEDDYIISGKVYYYDSTAATYAIVTFTNEVNEALEVQADAGGNYVVNLNNFPTDWAYGDEIVQRAFSSDETLQGYNLRYYLELGLQHLIVNPILPEPAQSGEIKPRICEMNAYHRDAGENKFSWSIADDGTTDYSDQSPSVVRLEVTGFDKDYGDDIPVGQTWTVQYTYLLRVWKVGDNELEEGIAESQMETEGPYTLTHGEYHNWDPSCKITLRFLWKNQPLNIKCQISCSIDDGDGPPETWSDPRTYQHTYDW